jgi:hypothetical protein
LSFYEGVGVRVLKIKESESEVLKIEESESEVLKIEESESEVLKIEESESELLYTDCTALSIKQGGQTDLYRTAQCHVPEDVTSAHQNSG